MYGLVFTASHSSEFRSSFLCSVERIWVFLVILNMLLCEITIFLKYYFVCYLYLPQRSMLLYHLSSSLEVLCSYVLSLHVSQNCRESGGGKHVWKSSGPNTTQSKVDTVLVQLCGTQQSGLLSSLLATTRETSSSLLISISCLFVESLAPFPYFYLNECFILY